MREMSGSKGESNFVWRCKNCKVGNFELFRGWCVVGVSAISAKVFETNVL